MSNRFIMLALSMEGPSSCCEHNAKCDLLQMTSNLCMLSIFMTSPYIHLDPSKLPACMCKIYGLVCMQSANVHVKE